MQGGGIGYGRVVERPPIPRLSDSMGEGKWKSSAMPPELREVTFVGVEAKQKLARRFLRKHGGSRQHCRDQDTARTHGGRSKPLGGTERGPSSGVWEETREGKAERKTETHIEGGGNIKKAMGELGRAELKRNGEMISQGGYLRDKLPLERVWDQSEAHVRRQGQADQTSAEKGRCLGHRRGWGPKLVPAGR